MIFIQGENILLVGGQTPSTQAIKAAAVVLVMADLRKVGCCPRIFTMPFIRHVCGLPPYELFSLTEETKFLYKALTEILERSFYLKHTMKKSTALKNWINSVHRGALLLSRIKTPDDCKKVQLLPPADNGSAMVKYFSWKINCIWSGWDAVWYISIFRCQDVCIL